MATTQPHWALLMVLIECEALIRTRISAQPPTRDPNATRTWFQLNLLGSMSSGTSMPACWAVLDRSSSSSCFLPFNATVMAGSRPARRRWLIAPGNRSEGTTRTTDRAARSGPATSAAEAMAPARSWSSRKSVAFEIPLRKSTMVAVPWSTSPRRVCGLMAPWEIRADLRSSNWANRSSRT